ncbi:hypothetical protein ACG83_01155 [Frankia sp. R43]|uniref:hypothetical protein n=1 Tax=Frankia sp. R43 TaxID=269536 RepID=UPI0006CA385D|nr:hypothetical protein [Frankia sp. R43]KPM56559.1 hypothetical protein ACG83_01155 [Frankia sp. R43]
MSAETTTSTSTAANTMNTAATPTSTASATDPSDRSDRSDRFRAELTRLRIRDPRTRLDAQLLRLGVVLMALGILLAIFGYTISHATTNPLQQRDALNISLIGVCVTVTGTALFLRYSLTGFLRFWLARILFEQREQHEQRELQAGLAERGGAG